MTAQQATRYSAPWFLVSPTFPSVWPEIMPVPPFRLAYSTFSAVAYEIVGTAGSTASTLYSVFPAAGNQAIAYTMFIDGQANHLWGVRGLLWADTGMNIAGVIALLLLLRVVFPEKKKVSATIAATEAYVAADAGR